VIYKSIEICRFYKQKTITIKKNTGRVLDCSEFLKLNENFLKCYQ
jgi:hypothetical protein